MLRLLYVLALVYAVSACGGGTEHDHDHDHAGHSHDHHDHDGHDHDGHDHSGHNHDAEEPTGTAFGKEVNPQGGMAVSQVSAKVESGEGAVEYDLGDGVMVQAVPTKVEGKVIEVCQAAGCWLTVQANDGTELFVDTEHKFLFPKDIVGKTVVIDGNAYKSVQSVEELRSIAEDEKKSKEEIAQITEPNEYYTLAAEGVVIVE